MKVLAINGSPNRDGFTASLLDMLLEVCGNAGADCERVNISDYTMGECGGCGKCVKNGVCCQNDDYVQLKAKMIDADGIIIGSPYYAGKPTEELKLFMDRLFLSSAYYCYFKHKYVVGVSTSAVNDPKKVAKYCADIGKLGAMGGAIVSGLLYECTVTRMDIKDIGSDQEIKERVFEVGNKLIKDIESKYIPGFYKLRCWFFSKWRGYVAAKIVGLFDGIRSRAVSFCENKGWIKKLNRIE
ncbi:MAG: flavodoxin family protein [Clostridia bacterium]|nr:flavodoxin family protein [Clostridia bacterium]